jgi:hypothetical protein
VLRNVKVARAISKANLSDLASFAHGKEDMTNPVDAMLYDLLIESYAEHSSIKVKNDRNLPTEKDDIMESLAGQAISDEILNVFGKLKRDAYGGLYCYRDAKVFLVPLQFDLCNSMLAGRRGSIEFTDPYAERKEITGGKTNFLLKF